MNNSHILIWGILVIGIVPLKSAHITGLSFTPILIRYANKVHCTEEQTLDRVLPYSNCLDHVRSPTGRSGTLRCWCFKVGGMLGRSNIQLQTRGYSQKESGTAGL